MSELLELIKINKNIEKQNEEIISLLKKIANEESNDEIEIECGEKEKNIPEKELDIDLSLDVGEVHFIDCGDIFKLSIKNNHLSIDNLTGDGETTNFYVAELIANESIKNNVSLDDSTVILTDSTKGSLPKVLSSCIKRNIKKAYMPWNQMAELISAPQVLQTLIKLDFYKSDDDLIGKLFKGTIKK